MDFADVISPLALPPISSNSSGFICPKQDCKKHYRSESLLMVSDFDEAGMSFECKLPY